MNLTTALESLCWGEQELIRASYKQEHRKYHNLKHLEDMLRWIPESVGSDIDKEVLVDAILYHDIVYAPEPVSPGMNETQSILAYMTVTSSMRPPASFESWDIWIEYDAAVAHCINATAYHTIDQQHLTGLCRLMLDLDLQYFACARDEFLAGCLAVQEELAPQYGETQFLRGNREFLKIMLKRKRIYYTIDDWETPARKNLQYRVEEITKILGD